MAKKAGKRNQIVVAALALMIAVAGYLSYTGISNMQEKNSVDTAVSDSQEGMISEIADESTDIDANAEMNSSQPGETVLTSASAFAAQAKVSREQIRAQNKQALLEVIENEGLSEDERQTAVASMVEMTDIAEKEAAAEMMLEAKGFTEVVVNLTGDTADVMVPADQLSDVQRAQIEDIIIRKTEISGENIVITPMNGTPAE